MQSVGVYSRDNIRSIGGGKRQKLFGRNYGHLVNQSKHKVIQFRIRIHSMWYQSIKIDK